MGKVFDKVALMLAGEDKGFQLNLQDLKSHPQIHKKYYYNKDLINSQNPAENWNFLQEINQFLQRSSK